MFSNINRKLEDVIIYLHDAKFYTKVWNFMYVNIVQRSQTFYPKFDRWVHYISECKYYLKGIRGANNNNFGSLLVKKLLYPPTFWWGCISWARSSLRSTVYALSRWSFWSSL